MRLSIVHAVLNSPEIVRRQMFHYNHVNMPDDVDVVLVDDGSEPPLSDMFNKYRMPIRFSYRIFETNDKRPWTQPEARNLGVKKASGEWVLCLDIDHIAPRKTIDFLLTDHGYDVIRFRREAGVLDQNGYLTQDMSVLHEWGLSPDRGLKLPPHGNSYAIRKSLFLELGGSRQKDHYPCRDELPIKSKLKKLEAEGKIKILQDQTKPFIYMFPNGRYCGDNDYNPFGLFHNLKR